MAALMALLPGQLHLGGHERDPTQRHRRTHARPAPRKELNRSPGPLRSTGMHKRVLTFIAVPVLALGLAACGSSSKASSSSTTSSASDSSGAQITIDSSFNYKTTPVTAGSTVTVKNNSDAQHT